jgi:hypothetical protein
MLHRTIVFFPLLALLVALVAPACSSADPACHVGADCASGACDSSGRCVPNPGGGGVDSGSPVGADAQVSEGGGVATDGSSADSGGSSGGGDDGSAPCQPNNDGTITREEVPMMAGLHANFMIAENVTMDTAGTTQPNGLRVWDFSASLSGDHKVLVTTDAPTGQWFSPQFTTATYTTKLSDTQPLLGVFQATSSALLLQGVVSPTSGTQQTALSYSPPANSLAVPLQLGTSWSSTSTVTGPADGVPSDYTELYSSKVDARGTLKLPYGTFQVLRVQTTLTRTIGVTVTVMRSLNFVTECFGPVATLSSQIDETNNEFTNVAEARRLTP